MDSPHSNQNTSLTALAPAAGGGPAAVSPDPAAVCGPDDDARLGVAIRR